MAAIYLVRDNQVLAKIISIVLSSIECYLSGLGSDGSTTEGALYWDTLTDTFNVSNAETLCERFVTRIKPETGGDVILRTESGICLITCMNGLTATITPHDIPVKDTDYTERVYFIDYDLPHNCDFARFRFEFSDIK